MITREADYAIRAVLHMALQEDSGHCVTTNELSRTMEIPYRFLRKLVAKLTAAGIVGSRKGRGGGLTLGRPTREISLHDVVYAVAPSALRINRCTGEDGTCSRLPKCAIHEVLSALQQKMDDSLTSVRFDVLADRSRA